MSALIDITSKMPELKPRPLGKFDVPPNVQVLTPLDIVDRLIVMYRGGGRDKSIPGLWLGIRKWLLDSQDFVMLTERLNYALVTFASKGVDMPPPLETYVDTWVRQVLKDPSLLKTERMGEFLVTHGSMLAAKGVKFDA